MTAALKRFPPPKSKMLHFRDLLVTPEFWLMSCSSVVLILFFILLIVRNDLSWAGRPGFILAEAILMLLAMCLNAWIYVRECYLSSAEMYRRIHKIISKITVTGLQTIQNVNMVNCPSISIVSVVRDGLSRSLPYALLVDGDLIELSYGEKCPVAARWVSALSGNSASSDIILPEDTHLTSGFFEKVLTGSHLNDEFRACCGRFKFKLLKSPVEDLIMEAMNAKRPTPPIYHCLKKIRKGLTTYFIWIILGLSLSLNVLRFVLVQQFHLTWLSFLFVFQVYVILPLLPFSIVVEWLIVCMLGDAKLLLILELLQQSRTPFDDSAGVDQFDEQAPPPTKDISVTPEMILKKFMSILKNEVGDVGTLIRSSHFLESLSAVTVICSVDRHGSLTAPSPSPEQVFLLHHDSPDGVMLEIFMNPESSSYLSFEDKNWKERLNSLKPLGLEFSLCSRCRLPGSKRAEIHKRAAGLANLPHALAAQQVCLCYLGKEIGFPEDTLSNYQLITEIFTSLTYSQQNTSTTETQIASHSFFQFGRNIVVFSEGSTDLLLGISSDYWNGRIIEKLNEHIRAKIIEFHSNAVTKDLQCVSYSFNPSLKSSDLLELKSSLDDKKNIPVFDISQSSPESSAANHQVKQFLNEEIFLGTLAFGFEPKKDVREFIEDLRLAGIRFVYFSSTAERESKSFAERLGLETDWNSCVLLSSSKSNEVGYLEDHDIKAKLPRGIENIRNHLEKVDDIPLHVSLFADCHPKSIREMIRIFQENGEVVCCIGSTLHHANSLSFATADVSFGIEPYLKSLSRKKNIDPPPFSLGATLCSLSCLFNLSYDTSLYVLSQAIKESRVFVRNAIQAFFFMFASHITLSLTNFLSFVCMQPPVYFGHQLLWMMWLIIPLLGFALLFSPEGDEDVMKLMPGKNKEHLAEFWRYISYFSIRFIPVSITTVVVFILCLKIYYPISESPMPSFLAIDWMDQSSEQSWALSYAQNLAMCCFVLSLIVISASFQHRVKHIWEFSPLKNYIWMTSSFLCIIMQSVFTTISLMQGPHTFSKCAWLLGIVFGWAIPLLVLQELVKLRDKKEYIRFQKRSKLEFNTKLGCYSPV